ncbi:MAG TPA: hypothetical protein VHB93_01905 [Candidatus Paceibacterota bacterium]|nr:hypothetical protein [Candidatus Paceibacterota bacterium]
MKILIAGIVLIIVLGLGGFVYRNVLEHPGTPTAPGTACTLEAKLCPDGTAVGRTGPNCEFAACPAPNVSLDSVKIAFAVPAGYVANPAALGSDATLVAAYEKSGSTTPADAIVVRDYPIPAGQTASDVILANTHLEPSDMPPKDMNAFTPKIIGTHTYSEITIERFEAVVHTAYFLPRATDVLEFEVLEHNVELWQNANLIPDNLPEHQALIKMLGTLEDQSPQPQ